MSRITGIRNTLRGYRQTITNVWKSIYNPILELMKSQGKEEILDRQTVIASGLEYDIKNPDSLLADKGFDLKIYDRMLLDDRIKFVFELKKMLALHVDREVIAASDDSKDIEIRDFVQENFDRLKMPSFDGVLDNLLDSIAYGFKVGEIVWELDEKYYWKKIKFQHSIFFDFKYDDYNNLDNVHYGFYYGNDTIIPADEFLDKFIVMVYPYLKDGNWYGDSDLKEVYFEWWSKYNIKRWRNQFIQGRGKPVPHVVYDSVKTSTSELNNIKTMFENWQDSMYVLIPGTTDPISKELIGKFKVDWENVGTKENVDLHNETLDKIDKAITRKMIFPDKLGFTEDGSGSYAQSQKIFDIVIMNIKKTHQRLEDVINPKVRQLVDLNFPNVKEYPKWRFCKIDKTIEKELLGVLIDKKVIDRREKWIRGYINIPELSAKEKEEIEKAKEEDRKNMPTFPPKVPDEEDIKKEDINEKEEDNSSIKEDTKKKEEMKGQIVGQIPVNFKKIESQYDYYEQEFIDLYNVLYLKEIDRLSKQINKSKVVETGNIKELATLRINKTDFKKLFTAYYFKLYLSGKKDGFVELKPRIQNSDIEIKLKAIEFNEEWLDKEWIKSFLKEMGPLGVLTKKDKSFLRNLKDRAFLDIGELENTMTKIAERTVSSGIRNGLTIGTISEQVKKTLKDNMKQYSTTIARTNASTDYNSGRMNFFKSEGVNDVIESYQYSSIIDQDTSLFCLERDGQIILPSDPDFERITPPCHFNCRSLLIPILTTDKENVDSYYYDYENKFKGWKGSTQPAKNFGGGS